MNMKIKRFNSLDSFSGCDGNHNVSVMLLTKMKPAYWK